MTEQQLFDLYPELALMPPAGLKEDLWRQLEQMSERMKFMVATAYKRAGFQTVTPYMTVPRIETAIEFIEKAPETFWHKLQPAEYGFYSNVNPKKSHPRWSQAYEKVIPTMERRQTLMYNGYEEVASLYDGKEF